MCRWSLRSETFLSNSEDISNVEHTHSVRAGTADITDLMNVGLGENVGENGFVEMGVLDWVAGCNFVKNQRNLCKYSAKTFCDK